MIKKLMVLLSTGFGLGYSPWFPGSVGCLLGVPIVWAIQQTGAHLDMGLSFQVGVATCLSLLSIPICHVGENAAGRKDPHCVVADEYLTFPICMIGLPFSPAIIAIAFVSNRILDIYKPYPARQLQVLPGGLGITIDDVFSATYSLAFNHAAYWLIRQQGWM